MAISVPRIVVSDYPWIKGFIRETTGKFSALNRADTAEWIIEGRGSGIGEFWVQ